MISNSFYNRATINTLIAVLSTGISVLLAILIMPVIVLSFGAENWARYAFFVLYVAALQCVETALQSYSLQVRAIANTKDIEYEWRNDVVLRRWMKWLAFTACIAILANHVIEIISDGEMRALLNLAVVNVFPRALCAVFKGNLLGQQSQTKYYLVTTVFNVGRPLFLLLCLWLANVHSVVTLAQLYVMFSLFELTVLWLLLGKKRDKDDAIAKQATSEPHLLPTLLAANLMSTLSTNFDKLLAYGSLSLRLLAEYTFAAQIAALLTLFVNAAVAAFSPRFREHYIRREFGQIRRLHMLLSAFNNFLVLAAMAFFLTNGEFFLSVFKSEIDHKKLLDTFAILAGAVSVSSNLWIPGAIATSTGRSHFNVFTNIGFVVVYLLTFLLLRDIFHYSIFALSMLCAAIVTTTAGLVYFKLRVLDFSLLRYGFISILVPVLIVGITYVFPALLIKSRFDGVLPSLAFAAIWSTTILLVAFCSRHLLNLGWEHSD